MGGSSSKDIKVATLNYAGIAYSPFQFYSGTEDDRRELKDLCYIFQKLVIKKLKMLNEQGEDVIQIPKKFDWGLKTIEKNMQKQRYSPVYRSDVGIIQGHLLSQRQFQQKWSNDFKKNKYLVDFGGQLQEQQVQMCRDYDYLLYKTFIEYLYNTKILNISDQKDFQISYVDRLQELRSSLTEDKKRKEKEERSQLKQEYINFLDRQFEKPFLKHEAKLNAIKTILKTEDILFLQDVSDDLIDSLKNEGHINVITPSKRHDCAILLKEGSFKTLYDEEKIHSEASKQKDNNKYSLFGKQNFDVEKGASTPAICFVDDYLFINVHLHNPKSNPKQDAFLRMIKHLNDITEAYPSLKIVIGGDFFRIITRDMQFYGQQFKNAQEIRQRFFDKFKVFPSDAHQCTTRKTRTWMQSQRNKAEKDEQTCRDFILTSMNLQSSKIKKLGDILLGEHLLTDKHPFDHYIVRSTLSRSE